MKMRLGPVLLSLGMALPGLQAGPGTRQPAADTTAAAPRPQLASLVIYLDDGRTYSLTQAELQDARGGVLFWNDWAVYNILVPFYVFHRTLPTSPGDVVRLWNTPNASGELPAFLIKPSCIPSYPLNPSGPALVPPLRAHRPKVTAILVGYQDGRSYALNALELHDPRSGVMFWGDFAVKNMLVPFYTFTRGLPTKPGDVLRLWNTPAPTKTKGFTDLPETPGFILKPACIPEYPLGGGTEP